APTCTPTDCGHRSGPAPHPGGGAVGPANAGGGAPGRGPAGWAVRRRKGRGGGVPRRAGAARAAAWWRKGRGGRWCGGAGSSRGGERRGRGALARAAWHGELAARGSDAGRRPGAGWLRRCIPTTLAGSALHCQRHPAPRRLFAMSPSPSGASTAPADLTLVPRPEATIAPAVPLALLESVRAHDRPSEVLEDEDLTVSMPRRLGLTDVIDSQIRRYRANGRRAVPLTEVADLFRLVLRRPDAEAILRAAGTMIGRELFSTGAPGALRLLPRTARNALLRRALRRR